MPFFYFTSTGDNILLLSMRVFKYASAISISQWRATIGNFNCYKSKSSNKKCNQQLLNDVITILISFGYIFIRLFLGNITYIITMILLVSMSPFILLIYSMFSSFPVLKHINRFSQNLDDINMLYYLTHSFTFTLHLDSCIIYLCIFLSIG